MPTFNITVDGTLPGQVLTAPSAALFMGKTFGGAKVAIEASPDNTNWAVIARSQEVNNPGVGVVAQCVLPVGWYVRTRTTDASATTDIVVVIG